MPVETLFMNSRVVAKDKGNIPSNPPLRRFKIKQQLIGQYDFWLQYSNKLPEGILFHLGIAFVKTAIGVVVDVSRIGRLVQKTTLG